MRTNADLTTGSYLREGLLYSDPLIRLTTAQHAKRLPRHVLSVEDYDSDPALNSA